MTLNATELWTQLHERLLSFIRRRVRNQSDAEDILQEVFARVHANIGSLVNRQRVQSWVYQITRHAIVDYYRTKEQVAEVDLAPEVVEDDDSGAEQELARCIQPLLTALPRESREAVALTELEGLTQRAAAERVGLSLSGMKSRVQRGREQLRQRLLECCHIEFDRRGRVVDYEAGECSVCGAGRGAAGVSDY